MRDFLEELIRRWRQTLPSWLVAVLIAVLLAGLVTGGVTAIAGGGNPDNQTVAAKVRGSGGGPVYEIRTTVRSSENCGAKTPEVGQVERATISMKMERGKLIASTGAASPLPGTYTYYEGFIRADGTFQLEAVGFLPADIHGSRMEGTMSPEGEIVTGSWTFGIPGTRQNGLDDDSCFVETGPLASSFYFGWDSFDWRKEWRR